MQQCLLSARVLMDLQASWKDEYGKTLKALESSDSAA